MNFYTVGDSDEPDAEVADSLFSVSHTDVADLRSSEVPTRMSNLRFLEVRVAQLNAHMYAGIQICTAYG